MGLGVDDRNIGREKPDRGDREREPHGGRPSRDGVLRILDEGVATADKTAASSRLLASRVRNLPSIVTVPTCGSSQRRWTFCALICASTQATVVWAKVTRASGWRLKPVKRKPFTVKG